MLAVATVSLVVSFFDCEGSLPHVRSRGFGDIILKLLVMSVCHAKLPPVVVSVTLSSP